MAITPDMMNFTGQPEEPVPTDPSQVASLVQQLAGNPQQQQLLVELVRQGMTKGLGVQDNGALGFTQQGMGAQGYGGPLRQSDVPTNQIGQLMKTDQANAVSDENRIRQLPFGGGKFGDVMDLLGGLPKGSSKEVQEGILNQKFPGLVPSAHVAAGSKPLTPEQSSKLWRFNPDTRDFDPVPSEMMNLPPAELTKQGYRVYTDKQRGVVDELKDVDVAFDQLRSAVNNIKGKNVAQLKGSELTGGNFGFGPEGAVLQKARTNFTTIMDKFLGGTRAAASPQMQEIRSKVIPSILSSNKVSDTLMNDLEGLIKTMQNNRLKTVVGRQAFSKVDQDVIDTQAKKVLQEYKNPTKTAPAAQQGPLTGTSKSGRPIISNDGGKTWEYAG